MVLIDFDFSILAFLFRSLLRKGGGRYSFLSIPSTKKGWFIMFHTISIDRQSIFLSDIQTV